MDLMLCEILFPGVKVIDQQSKMIAAIMRDHFPGPLANEMQLLIGAQTKPGTGKRERRPRDRLQPQHVAIERDAPLDIGNMQGDVIELREEQIQISNFGFQICQSSERLS